MQLVEVRAIGPLIQEPDDQRLDTGYAGGGVQFCRAREPVSIPKAFKPGRVDHPVYRVRVGRCCSEPSQLASQSHNPIVVVTKLRSPILRGHSLGHWIVLAAATNRLRDIPGVQTGDIGWRCSRCDQSCWNGWATAILDPAKRVASGLKIACAAAPERGINPTSVRARRTRE